MKKYISVIIISILSLMLAACTQNEQGTYYPNSIEMKENLENKGYTVSVTNDFDKKYTGTYLLATKDNDFIEFYWLDEVEAADYFKKKTEEKHKKYDRCVSIENDSEFGTLVFCATNPASDAAGINIVDVKVNI